MDEQGCPRCKTTKYRNPSLKLLVNACGHSLCESCVDMLFMKGSGACPECGTALRRNNYRLQVFEDAWVEKEVDIRKRILKDFNKREEDFGSLREYNDYLEKIESIIFNLVNGVELESTRKLVEQYKKENREFIKKNQTKLSRDDEYLKELVDQQKHEEAVRRQLITEEENREKSLKRKNKEALIDQLMFSDMPAQSIVASHKQTSSSAKEEELKATTYAGPSFTGIKNGQQSVFSSGDQVKESEPYAYTPFVMDLCGPPCPSMDEIVCNGYLNNVRASTDAELVGGFEAKVACQRAMQDAFCGLFYFPPISHQSPSPVSSSSSQPQSRAHSPMVIS